jgi:hypothetical protein
MVRAAEMTYAEFLHLVELQNDSDVSRSRGSSIFIEAGLDSGDHRSGFPTSNSQLARYKTSTLPVDLIGGNYCRYIHTTDKLSHPNHFNIHRDLIQSP